MVVLIAMKEGAKVGGRPGRRGQPLCLLLRHVNWHSAPSADLQVHSRLGISSNLKIELRVRYDSGHITREFFSP